MTKKEYLTRTTPLTRAIITKYGWRTLRNVGPGNPLTVEFSLRIYATHRAEFNRRFPGQLPAEQFSAAILDTIDELRSIW